MDKMTYNERVRLIAEEMASYYNEDRTWSSHIRWNARREEAEIAVANMAEAYRYAFKQSAYGYGNHIDDETIDGQTNHFLFEYGLIPDKKETHA